MQEQLEGKVLQVEFISTPISVAELSGAPASKAIDLNVSRDTGIKIEKVTEEGDEELWPGTEHTPRRSLALRRSGLIRLHAVPVAGPPLAHEHLYVLGEFIFVRKATWEAVPTLNTLHVLAVCSQR